jgi:hypothetical protein
LGYPYSVIFSLLFQQSRSPLLVIIPPEYIYPLRGERYKERSARKMSLIAM